MGSSDRIFSATAKDAISQWRCLQVTFKKHSLRSPVTWEVSPAQLNRNRDNCVRAELPKFVFNPSLAASICQQSLFCESLSYLALQQKRGELHKCVSTWCYIFSPAYLELGIALNLFICMKIYHCWQNSSQNWVFLKSVSTG